LHREPDFSGFFHYKRKLKSTSFDKGDLLLELIKSPEYRTGRMVGRAEDMITIGVPWNVRVAIIIATPTITRYKFRKTYENLKRHTHSQYQLIIVETHFDEEIYCHPRDMNIAPKGTDADFYVFMNDDIYVKPGWLDGLVQTALQDKRIGIVGGLFFYPDGRIQHAGGYIISYDPHDFDQVKVQHRFYRKHLHECPQALEQRDCVFVTGAIQLVRKECINDIGLWDERLCLSWNDVEYGFRAWFNGWRVVYTPKCQAIHDEGATILPSGRAFEYYKRSWKLLYGKWSRDDIRRLINLVRKSNRKHYGVDEPEMVV